MSPLWGFRGRKPVARATEVLVEEFGEELIVYDQRTDRVHCLTASARKVWGACDGSTTVEQLGPALGLDAEVVARALAELEASGLLEAGTTAGVTRREATARLASIGAAAASAPLIYSIAAPTPALAASEAVCEMAGCGKTAGSPPLVCPTGCLVCGFSGCKNGTKTCTGSTGYCVAACTTSHCNQTKVNGSLCGCSSCTCATVSGGCAKTQCGT